ncbi:ATP-dependent helicase [Roseiconus nitratireducens]|uniref:DNA 3'-5' helicase n=1 Tax=Roseiconus nitratireducens TaxID=2605748 RepID=A0A5M6D2C9_9BACT|nr:ATP-dependent helicase [Roseiconus nitratireducens]KAA5539295.1 ATP-dependent helicase [Roseiconus nitratireducens]
MELNPQQRRAAEFDDADVLVLAGAGTGKTSTIVARVAHLVRRDVDPRRILLLTFTRRAAREMRHRLGRQIGADVAKRVPTGTFHHFCLQSLRRWPEWFHCASLTIIDRDDQLQLMKLARAAVIGKDPTFPKSGELANYYSFARNTNRPLKEYLDEFTSHEPDCVARIEAVLKDYGARKQQCKYFDYDDILHLFARQLHRDPVVRQKLQRRYDHLLVDEMQDTNPLQWLILDGLREPAKLFCVGDDAQSIYAFRGADFQNVHAFTERVPGASVLKLEHNYRSTQEILDLSNWLLEQSPLKYDKRLTATRGSGSKPVRVEVDDDFEEADWITRDLMQRHEGDDPWRDHMILTRSAWAARGVEASLIEHEIPYRFIGGTQLLQSAHVKDLLSLLRVIHNPSDQLAWMRYLTQWPRIGEKTAATTINQLLTLTEPAQREDLLSKRFSNQPRLAESITECVAVWASVPDVIATAADKLTPLLERKYDDWDRRQKDFKLLKRLAKKHATVADFLETYTLDPISESEASNDDQDDAVTLITVHSAKGTEAPVCYLIGVQPGNYPHVRSIGDEQKEEEERRVLYVAMTRAKNELILTGTVRSRGAFVPHHNRSFQGGSGQPFFLSSMPDNLCATDLDFETDFSDGPILSFRRP